jgi:glycosyltransferase involved in cell wall biosynthesis
MVAGLVTVSNNNHDVEMFIKNGYDGFYSSDPEELADYLLFLHRNPAEMQAMARRSRRVALDVFNHDRYLFAWQRKISSLVT